MKNIIKITKKYLKNTNGTTNLDKLRSVEFFLTLPYLAIPILLESDKNLIID